MEKFVLKQSGKEVRIGDKLIKKGVINTPMGKGVIVEEVLVDEETLPKLLEAGIIVPAGEKKIDTTVPMEIEFYIEKVANKLGWKLEKTGNYLNNITSILPAAALSIMLREIAIELDKKYEDHIEKSPEIYVISSLDGRITKANKAHIKNYRNFAAFRSIEDAKIACRIVKPLLKEMFKSDSK